MGSTPKYSLPWPEQLEGNDVSDDIRALALAVEVGLQAASRVVTQTFTASGTWTKPAGCLAVVVAIVGSGGGGGYRQGGSQVLYPGGGGGEFVEGTFPAPALPSTVSVTIGAGGTQAQAGGRTEFGDFLAALGGRGASVSVPGLGAGAVSASQHWANSGGSGAGSAPGEADENQGGYGSLRGGAGGGHASINSDGSFRTATAGGRVGATSYGIRGGAQTPTGGGTAGPDGRAGTGEGGGGGTTGGAGGTPGGGGGGGVSAGGPGARGEVRVYAICTGKA